MYARPLLATIAMLLFWSAGPCLAAGLEVGVYLRTDGSAPEPILNAMKVELGSILDRAGFQMKWWSGQSTERIEAEELIVVDLRGSCQAPRTPSQRRAALHQFELGSTSVVGREILPFSSLDCGTLNDLLSGDVSRMKATLREFVYGRAMARVLAHEFYHVLARTHNHTAQGLAKKAHSANDLLADRFDFDSGALAQLSEVNRTAAWQHALAARRQAKTQTGSENALEAPAEPAALETVVTRQ
jgi:hypothetical protein